MTDLEVDILRIIKSHVGYENKITQYEIAKKLIRDTAHTITYRNVRMIIEDLIKQGYPIISTPRNGGGYCWQKTTLEGVECWKRIRRQAVKLFIKARKIRSNSRMGQMNLDIRF